MRTCVHAALRCFFFLLGTTGTAVDAASLAQAGLRLVWRAQSSIAAVFPGFMTVEAALQQGRVAEGLTGVALFLAV
jgi:hypothetical protein